jgi:hypothetical protein
VNFKVSIPEMHLWISWELVADPLGSVDHTWGTTGIKPFVVSVLFHDAFKCYD